MKSVGWPPGSVEGHGCFAHAGDGYAGDATGLFEPFDDQPQGRSERAPELFRVVVRPAGSRVAGGRRRAGVRHGSAATVEGHDLYVGRADIGPDQERFSSHRTLGEQPRNG
jgi:hypothetical protein